MPTLSQFYIYKAFDLTISSEFECSELPASTALDYDVIIQTGAISDPHSRGYTRQIMPGVTFHASQDSLVLNIKNIARYLVSNGNRIIVDQHINADPNLVRLFLFGSAFGALLFQRGILPLHGSSIVTPCGSVLFVGHSGYGKSTLAGVFHQRGYPVLSDDVSAVSSTHGIPHILPAYPRILLWSDSMGHIGVNGAGLKPAHAKDNKFQVPVSNNFASEKSPLQAIYVLNPTSSRNIDIVALEGFPKLKILTEHTYRGQFFEDMKLTSQHFYQISAIGRHAHVFRLDRPDDASRIGELANTIEKHFNHQYCRGC